MEDFFYAGGLPALLDDLGDLLDTSAPTVERVDARARTSPGAEVFDDDVIRTPDDPLRRGRHARGAARQPRPRRRGDQALAAAEARLHRHTGPAVVFENYDDMAARIDDPDLDIDDRTRCSCCAAPGPQGAPGHAGVGQLPIPKKLLEQGVRDMVRISDARMSGTSYGACVLHVAPESIVGGPLALVRDGDLIELDVAGPPPRPDGRPTRSSRSAGARLATARRPKYAPRLRRAVSASTSPRPTRAATSTSSEARRAVPEPEIH